MLEVVNNNSQTLSVGGTAQLGTVKFENCNSVVINDNAIKLSRPGYYMIGINGTVGGTSPIELSLIDNSTGVVESGGKITVGGLTTTNTTLFPFSFQTIVKVDRSCCIVNNTKNLILNNTGTASTILSRLNIVVVKLD